MHPTTAFSTTSVRQSAAFYMAHGFFPVPVPRRRKKAVFEGWPDLRLTPDQLKAHFADDRSQNIGLILAHETGLVDFDLDSPEAVAAGNRWLPPTTWISGRQGKPRSHHWFRVKTPVTYMKFTNLHGATLLELRAGDGLQTVVPPSIHEEGDEIVWHELAGEPAALDGAELTRLAGEIATLALLAEHWPKVAGQRQDLFMALAGGLVRLAWPPGRAEDFLAALCELTGDDETRKRIATFTRTQNKCTNNDRTTGWPTLARLLGEQGAAVVAKVRGWLGVPTSAPATANDTAVPTAEPWAQPLPLSTVPDVAPFPLAVFPAEVRTLVETVARSMNCPIDYVAVPVLGVVGAALGAARVLEIKPGYQALPNLYLAVVAPPGSAKSPAQAAATMPLNLLDCDLENASQEQLRQYRLLLDDYKEELKEWRREKSSGPRPVEPVAPEERRLVVGDVTAERFKGLLAMNPKGIIREEDELTTLIVSMNAYRSGRGGDRQFYLSGWNGRVTTTDRQGDKQRGTGGTRAPLACLSILGGMTPDNLYLFRGEARQGRAVDDGFFDRFLFSFAEAFLDAAENWASIPATLTARWQALVERLHQLTLTEEQRGPTTVPKPQVRCLSDEGRDAWKTFTQAHAAERNHDQFPEHLRGVWAKLKAYGARLALILHELRWACGELADEAAPVDAETIRRAVALLDYFKSHARKVAVAIDLDPHIKNAKVVHRWLKRTAAGWPDEHDGTFALRDAYEGTKSSLDMERLEAALDLLERYGYLRSFDSAPRRGRGRPASARYAAHPALRGVVDGADDTDDIDDIEPNDGADGDDPVPTPPPSRGPRPPISANCAMPAKKNQRHGTRAEHAEGNSANCAMPLTEEVGAPSNGNSVVQRMNSAAGGVHGAGAGLVPTASHHSQNSVVDHASGNSANGAMPLTEEVSASDNSAAGHAVHKMNSIVGDGPAAIIIPSETASHNSQKSPPPLLSGALLLQTASHNSHNSLPVGHAGAVHLETASHNSQNSRLHGVLGAVPLQTPSHNSQKSAPDVKSDKGVVWTGLNENYEMLTYHLILNEADLAMVQTAVSESRYIGLDLETTGLNPRTDRVRLLAVNCDSNGGGRVTYLVDCFAVDPQPLFASLAEVELVIHNAAFDLGFLAALGFTPGIVHDTMLLSQVVYALGNNKGTPPLRHGLKDCVARELGQTLAKELQVSDWSGALTEEQLTYAAQDAAVLWPLFQQLQQKLAAADLRATAKLESETLPALVWLGRNGVPFDYERWCQLADAAQVEAERVRSALDGLAQNTGEGLFPVPWNWDSPQQVQQALADVGITVDSTRDDVLAGIDHPIAQLVRDYREAKKRESTYGRTWQEHVAADGRIYPRWVQLGANSGRMACTAPNMQNLPRGAYRQCIAAPEGRVLVKADYSQIELRIAAKVSGDKALLAAYQRGDDLHTLTAKHVLGIAEVTKQHRQLAKAINFGLLYGMGAKSFRAYAKTNYGVELTEREAEGYRDAFFRAYPGLKRWHRSQVDGVSETRTLGGRRVQQVGHFTEKLNLPVQGTGADGLKQALALLWQRRHECPDAMPVLAVHDEIVVECPEAQADAVSSWLRHAMLEAMAPLVAPVPVEVEVSVGRTWGGA